MKRRIVIEIDESKYNAIMNYPKEWDEWALNAIKRGTPLPKGHGRLFDERDIVSSNYKIIGNRIYELEPIIEADEE